MASESVSISSGWQLLGTSSTLTSMNDFNKSSIKTVWAYDKTTEVWKVFSSNAAINAIIDESATFEHMTGITANSGFWVDAESDDTITLGSSYTTPTITYAHGLSNISLSDIEGKTFTIPNYDYGYRYSSGIYNPYMLTFATDGSGQITQDSSVYATVSFSDSQIDVNGRTYKILSNNDNGIVFGYTHLDSSSQYSYYQYEMRGNVIVAIKDEATPFAGSMEDKLPYTRFTADGDNRTFTLDHNVTSSYIDSTGTINTSNYGTFTIDSNGSLLQENGYSNSYVDDANNTHISGNHWTDSYKTVYDLGDFSIEKHIYTSEDWSNRVRYDYNTTSYTLESELFLTADTDTWQKLFALTNNAFDSQEYRDGLIYNSGNVYPNESYIISEDGKTLTSYWDDGSSSAVSLNQNGIRIITTDEDGNIVVKSSYSYENHEFVSNSKLFSELSSETAVARKIVKEPLTLSEYKATIYKKLLEKK
jgi:hypothetical protein